MAGIAEISLFLGKMATKWAMKKAFSHSAEELQRWILQEAKNDEHQLSEKDLKTLDGLLATNSTFIDIVISRLKFWPQGGVLIAGPSGSGKSTLFEYLDSGQLAEPGSSTAGTPAIKFRYLSNAFNLKDTPGQYLNAERISETATAVSSNSERVLVIVFAAGYLKTEGMRNKEGDECLFKRPERSASHTMEEYLGLCADEEIEWMESLLSATGNLDPEKRFKSALIVINKVDHWWGSKEHVLSYYDGSIDAKCPIPNDVSHLTYERSVKFNACLNKLKSSLLAQGVSPTYHIVSSAYDSIYKQPPHGELSRQSALSSLIVFRGELRLRLLER